MTRVAKAAGVSQSTVSRVVNGRSIVNENTRQKVLKALDELGYEVLPPDQRTGRNPAVESRPTSGLLAVLVDSIGMRLHSEFILRLFSATQKAANEKGFSSILHFIERDQPLPGLFEKVDGFLIVNLSDEAPFPAGIQNRPVVCLTSFWEKGTSLILVGNEEVGQIASDYLIRRNHQNLAVISAEVGNPSFVARSQSFQERARQSKIQVRTYGASLERHDISAEIRSIYNLEDRVTNLVERYLAEQPLATGIFCPSDAMTAMVHRQLRRQAPEILEQIDLISCDNEEAYLAGLYPRPATIDLGIDARTQLAIEHIEAAIDSTSNPPPVELRIEPKLIAGDPQKAK